MEKTNKSSWVISLTVALIVAIVTSFVNYYTSNLQYNSQLKEKYLDRKIDLMEDITFLVTDYIEQTKYKGFYLLMEDMPANKKTLNTLEESRQFDLELQADFPLDYKESIKYEDTFNQLVSKLGFAELYFGDDVKEAIDNFSENILYKTPTEYINLYVTQQADNNNSEDSIPTVSFDKEDLFSQIDEYMYQYAIRITKAMRTELYNELH